MFGENNICEECGTFYNSLFASLLVTTKHFEIGTRINASRIQIADYGFNFTLLLTPLIIRLYL